MSEIQERKAEIEAFKSAFVKDRRLLIESHGPAAFDTANALYICPDTGKSVVINDSFMPSEGSGPVDSFIDDVQTAWWSERKALEPKSDEGKPIAVCGIYGHYLPGSGFDWLIFFEADTGGTEFWRVDARGQMTPLSRPDDEGVFRDQAGTFFDLRAGWRWLANTHQQEEEILVREVEAGYLIGARAGIPGDPDPAAREDPNLAYAFSRWDTQDYDVLEFLASADSESYPFHGERYGEWFGAQTTAVQSGQIELFALANSRNFFEAIVEICQQRSLVAHWPGQDPEGPLSICRGDVHIDLQFAYLFLRTLHTGRSFSEGIRAFIQPTMDLVEEAADLCDFLRGRLVEYQVSVVDGMTLEVEDKAEKMPMGRWSMVNLVGRSNLRGSSGQETILKILGFDPETGRLAPHPVNPDACPVCDEVAHLGKSIRPLAHLGNDPRTLAGVITQDHVIYFTVNCPQHSTPVLLEPGLGLAELEEKYRDKLDESLFDLLVFEQLNAEGTAHLAIGFDAGSLILEPARIRAVLETLKVSTSGAKHLYGLFPDALVIADAQLGGQELNSARLAAQEAIGQLFPGRAWPLDVNRTVDLDEAAMGKVNWRG